MPLRPWIFDRLPADVAAQNTRWAQVCSPQILSNQLKTLHRLLLWHQQTCRLTCVRDGAWSHALVHAPAPANRLSRELLSLERLVNASIAALRHCRGWLWFMFSLWWTKYRFLMTSYLWASTVLVFSSGWSVNQSACYVFQALLYEHFANTTLRNSSDGGQRTLQDRSKA